jgi:hypothetical protein
MKKGFILVGFVLLAVALNGLSVHHADGRPDYKAQFEEHYKDSKVAEAAKVAKCNICHYGKSKKMRNDYGSALAKQLNPDLYKKLIRDKKALAAKVDEVLESVEKEQSVSGVPFGKLIEDGKLPGTTPAGEEQ